MAVAVEPPMDRAGPRPAGRPGRLRRVGWWVTTGLAGLLVLFALVGPNRAGHLTPGVVLPRVLVTVPDVGRLAAVREVVRGLAEPAGELFFVVLEELAVAYIVDTLHE